MKIITLATICTGECGLYTWLYNFPFVQMNLKLEGMCVHVIIGLRQ